VNPVINWLSPKSALSIIVATSFAAGLNVYAVILTIGLLARVGRIALPPSLDALESWWVIGASAALFFVEFFGDKIPAFDLLWSALHTFIRVPVAALLSYLAADQLPLEMRVLCTLAGGLIALAAHGGKTALRAVITPSPEPLSNITLSVGEDVVAIGLTALATKHPYLAAGIALTGVLLIVVLIRFVVRALRALFAGAEHVPEG
jgi:Domain of unknown function (DUF4126)